MHSQLTTPSVSLGRNAGSELKELFRSQVNKPHCQVSLGRDAGSELKVEVVNGLHQIFDRFHPAVLAGSELKDDSYHAD
jgi:hypothetical protein